MRYDHGQLRRWCRDVLVATNVRPDDAAVLADSLLAADLRGLSTHGLVRLPIYVERLRRGLLNPRPELKVRRHGPATATVDADEGPGQLAGHLAMATAVDLAGEAGAAVVAVERSAHFGAASWYTMQAAEVGMVGIAMSHAEADVIPYGGREPALGTNPLSVAVPGPLDEPPIVLDMATSAVAMGRVLLARSSGEPIPEGWAVDAEGRPTTDPHEAVAVVPLGGPKGFGLAVLIDLLSALLTGGPFGTDIPRMYDNFEQPQHLGHVFLAVDISRFVPLDEFRRRVVTFRNQVTSAAAAPGFERVMLPGEPEVEAERRNRNEGLELSNETVEELRQLAVEAGVPFPA